MENVRLFIDNIGELLDIILLKGLNSTEEDDFDFDAAIELGSSLGFSLAVEYLQHIKKEIRKKNKSLDYDYDELIDRTVILGNYLEVVKRDLI